MYSQKMYELGSKKSTIRAIFEYGKQRAAIVGEENIYDFSLGNPNVPTPEFVKQAIIDILNEVSFCDKIIFGRIHYNKKASEYKEHKEFFNRTAKTVIDFCKEHNISYHIKNGTITEMTKDNGSVE